MNPKVNMYGWTPEQWAVVLGKFQDLPMRDMSDFLYIRKEWKQKFYVDPNPSVAGTTVYWDGVDTLLDLFAEKGISIEPMVMPSIAAVEEVVIEEASIDSSRIMIDGRYYDITPTDGKNLIDIKPIEKPPKHIRKLKI